MIVVSGVNITVGTERSQVDDLLDVAARFFDADDILVPHQLRHRGGQHIEPRARRHVVDDDRQINAVGNGIVVRDKTRLRGFVVVRGNDEKTVYADRFCRAAALDYRFGAVSAGSGDHGNTAVDPFNDELDHTQPFVNGHGRGLACRPADDDGVGTACNLQFDQPRERGEIDSAVTERGNDRDGRALKNRHTFTPPTVESVPQQSVLRWSQRPCGYCPQRTRDLRRCPRKSRGGSCPHTRDPCRLLQ